MAHDRPDQHVTLSFDNNELLRSDDYVDLGHITAEQPFDPFGSVKGVTLEFPLADPDPDVEHGRYRAASDDDLREWAEQHERGITDCERGSKRHARLLGLIRTEQQRRLRPDPLDVLTDDQRAALHEREIDTLRRFARDIEQWSDTNLFWQNFRASRSYDRIAADFATRDLNAGSLSAYSTAIVALLRAEQDRRSNSSTR